MKRSFHVVATTQKGLEVVLDSLNTYEEARDFAKDRLLTLAPDVQLVITHGGQLVWGPYFVDGKYKP